MPKVANIRKLAERIGLGCRVTGVAKPITYRSVAERLKDCDVIFGCTDDEWGRSILNRLAVYYYIPVIDMGVRIASIGGAVESVQGRVTIFSSWGFMPVLPRANRCRICGGGASGD